MAEGSDDDLPPGIDLGSEQEALPRCWPETDTTQTAGERSGRARWFCLAWAHGTCALGALCEQRHRLPRNEDEIKLAHSADLCGIVEEAKDVRAGRLWEKYSWDGAAGDRPRTGKGHVSVAINASFMQRHRSHLQRTFHNVRRCLVAPQGGMAR